MAKAESKQRRRSWILPDREITDPEVYRSRREFLAGMAAAGLLPALSSCESVGPRGGAPTLFRAPVGTYPAARNPRYTVPERPLTSRHQATSYNNFYEFSYTKEGVVAAVRDFSTAPWKVEVAGLVERPGTIDLEDFFRNLPSEERVYRFRCVEAWAMTVPWSGFPLRAFLEWVRPRPEARYLAMHTVVRPAEAPNQAAESQYSWPYCEALRLDEAGHELAFLAHGIYGEDLPRQNGAPLRLVVPWKYGLKNIKSIVRFELCAERPPTFWNAFKPHEYSWLSNVEPEVPHPRWSQASERLLDSGERVPTLPYNGYADLVGGLYA